MQEAQQASYAGGSTCKPPMQEAQQASSYHASHAHIYVYMQIWRTSLISIQDLSLCKLKLKLLNEDPLLFDNAGNLRLKHFVFSMLAGLEGHLLLEEGEWPPGLMKLLDLAPISLSF